MGRQLGSVPCLPQALVALFKASPEASLMQMSESPQVKLAVLLTLNDTERSNALTTFYI